MAKAKDSKPIPPWRQARLDAGLTVEEAAELARVGRKYLMAAESSGDVSYSLGIKLCRIYKCSKNLMFFGRLER